MVEIFLSYENVEEDIRCKELTFFSSTMAKTLAGGLREQWQSIIDVLEEVIDVYDRANRAISLGSDIPHRKEGIENGVRPRDVVLDAGSGLGRMAEITIQNVPNVQEIILLDALQPMLEVSKSRLRGERCSYVRGLFETMPFRERAFNSVIMGYALRDAKDLSTALKEISGVLMKEGRLTIVDLGKPDGSIPRFFMSVYWRYLAVLLAMIAVGRKGRLFAALYTTYRRLPLNSELTKILNSIFSEVDIVVKMMGGAVVINCKKYPPS